MRLHILSDLHLEFGPVSLPQTDADIIVLAGDIHMGHDGAHWARKQWPETPIIYVLGNHEFYRDELPGLTDRLRRLCQKTNIHLLENDGLELDGVSFLGCTLWTDFELLDDAATALAVAETAMADYFQISCSGENRCLESKDTRHLHVQSRDWLTRQLASSRSARTVVVTHHAPSPRSIPPFHVGSPLNPAFASDLEALMGSGSVPLWIHGHTHHNVDYHVGTTRVLSNQRGYPDAPVAGFDPTLVIEI